MTMAPSRLAVLLTCHNRKSRTLDCIRQVLVQAGEGIFRVSVILVDDGSTDGTSQAVQEQFPEVEVLRGSGNLYWSRGMRTAFACARSRNFDFYLLLNDDTRFYHDAISRLLDTYHLVTRNGRGDAIIVGSTMNPSSGTLSYGGWRRISRINPADCRKVEPGDKPNRCDTMNGNCVLIPNEVAERVGNLDAEFT